MVFVAKPCTNLGAQVSVKGHSYLIYVGKHQCVYVNDDVCRCVRVCQELGEDFMDGDKKCSTRMERYSKCCSFKWVNEN